MRAWAILYAWCSWGVAGRKPKTRSRESNSASKGKGPLSKGTGIMRDLLAFFVGMQVVFMAREEMENVKCKMAEVR